ncbi:basic proline-rich protein-like [Macrobrachium nipponense]|uniref:basic proline-rich protein-like n=1 Tax=Macrobrachium nipponense TaxID=159736 RepID=UPI0030C81C77
MGALSPPRKTDGLYQRRALGALPRRGNDWNGLTSRGRGALPGHRAGSRALPFLRPFGTGPPAFLATAGRKPFPFFGWDGQASSWPTPVEPFPFFCWDGHASPGPPRSRGPPPSLRPLGTGSPPGQPPGRSPSPSSAGTGRPLLGQPPVRALPLFGCGGAASPGPHAGRALPPYSAWDPWPQPLLATAGGSPSPFFGLGRGSLSWPPPVRALPPSSALGRASLLPGQPPVEPFPQLRPLGRAAPSSWPRPVEGPSTSWLEGGQPLLGPPQVEPFPLASAGTGSLSW